MISKIRAMIILVTFASTPAISASAVIAAMVYTATYDNSLSLFVFVTTIPVTLFVVVVVFVWFASYMDDRLGDVGEWRMVEKDGRKRAVRVPKVYAGGERDHETEQWLRENME